MCGIAGELRFGPSPSLADWAAISALMARRGPDDEGAWVSHDRICTLVFRRLSIIDLSPLGHQPMVTSDGRHAIVYNGELYNYRELRRELESHGAQFRSTSDTEVVLSALVRWGTAALTRFNGMFALAWFDSAARRLVLARDHAGIKPLYFSRTRNGVVFASQYNQILAHPWSRSLPVSRDALAVYLRIAFVPAPYALHEHTHMLEPGAFVEFVADGTERRGRHFELPQWMPPTLSGGEAVEAVDAALTSAVRRQLVSDVPVAAFLSGGVDSPLVVSKMRAAMSSPCAFTIGTGEARTDETEDARRYAAELGVEHVVEQVNESQAVALLDDVIEACGEPLGDYSIFPTMLVSRLARSRFKVVLSGDGGDELFWGYVKRMAQIVECAPEFKRQYPLRVAEWMVKRVTGNGAGEHLRWPSLGDGQLQKHTHLRGGWLERVFPTLPAWPDGFRTFAYDGSDSDRAAQWQRWNELVCHLTMVLLKVDRGSMHHSLEVRVPLLDREVIETALKVDWRACLDPERMLGKLPLRQILARTVRHQTSSKRGFEVPMAHWLRTSLRPTFEDAVLARSEIAGLPLNRTAVEALYRQHLSGRADHAWGLWPILSLSLWELKHGRAPAAVRHSSAAQAS